MFEQHPPSKARWFSFHLTRANAPWAYSRGAPFRCIGALELYTTLMCVILFAGNWPRDSAGQIAISGTTEDLYSDFGVHAILV